MTLPIVSWLLWKLQKWWYFHVFQGLSISVPKSTGSWTCMEAWRSTKPIPSISRLLDMCPSTVLASCQLSYFVASAVSLHLLADSLCHLALVCPQAYLPHSGHPFAERPMAKRAPACPMMGTSPQSSGARGCSRFHDRAWDSYFPVFVGPTLLLDINGAKQLTFTGFHRCTVIRIITLNPQLNKVSRGRSHCWCC